MEEYEARALKDKEDIRLFIEEKDPYAKIKILRSFKPIYTKHANAIIEEATKCPDPRIILAAYSRYPLEVAKRIDIAKIKKNLNLLFEVGFIQNTDPDLRFDVLDQFWMYSKKAEAMRELLPFLFKDPYARIRGQAIFWAYRLREDTKLRMVIPTFIDDTDRMLSTPASEIFVLLFLEENRTREIRFKLMIGGLLGTPMEHKGWIGIAIEPEKLLGQRLIERNSNSPLEGPNFLHNKLNPRFIIDEDIVILQLRNLDTKKVLEHSDFITGIFCETCSKSYKAPKVGTHTNVFVDTIFHASALQVTYKTIECASGHILVKT